MIRHDLKEFPFEYMVRDDYGQMVSSGIEGNIEITIYSYSQKNTNDIRYSNATYIGLTKADVADNIIIHYYDKKLKVLFVDNFGRWNQVYLNEL